MTKEKERALRDIKREILMKEISSIIKLMAEVSINGKKEKFTMVNGSMAKKRVMEFGEVYLVTATLANGR